MSIIKKIFVWLGALIVLSLIVVGGAILFVQNQSATLSGNVTGLTPAISASDHFLGNPGAKVTLVEYADFECPACAEYYPLVKQLANDYTDKILFVYRYFPLPQHANAIPTAKASEAAGDQGKFWEMHDLLFDNQTKWENVSDPNKYSGWLC